METIRELCEKSMRNGTFTTHYHAKWGNPVWGINEEDFTLTGNCRIKTAAGRNRNNAVMEIASNNNGRTFGITVKAYNTVIAAILVNPDREEAYIFEAVVTSRTDIEILRNVAEMLSSRGVAALVRRDGAWIHTGPIDYFDFKYVAKQQYNYCPTGNY